MHKGVRDIVSTRLYGFKLLTFLCKSVSEDRVLGNRFDQLLDVDLGLCSFTSVFIAELV